MTTTPSPRYLGGYAISGQEPVLLYEEPADARPSLAASIGDVVADFKVRKAARDAELAAQRAKLVADSLIWCATVPTREQVRDGWVSQLQAAEAELLSLDATQRWGRWTQDQYAEVCRPARERASQARMVLLEIGL